MLLDFFKKIKNNFSLPMVFASLLFGVLFLVFSPAEAVFAKDDNASIISKSLHVQSWRTPAGAKVFFVRMPNHPMLDVRALFYAGSSRDGAHQGVAMLTNGVMTEATDKYNAYELRDALDGLGSILKVVVGRQVAQIDLRCLTYSNYMQPSLDIMRGVIGQPVFRDKDISRIKKHIIAALKSYQQDPAEVALNTMFGVLYKGQSYAHSPFGSVSSINKLTKLQLINFYKKYYVALNMRLIIVGDVTRSKAEEISNRLTNLLPRGHIAKNLMPAKKLSKEKLVHRDFPATQTHILMGQIGLGYNDPEFYPFMVGNYILGGSGLGSQLFNFIRNKHGLAYSVRSYFVPTSYRGVFVVNMQTRNKQAMRALRLMRDFVAGYIKKGPTELQVKKAKYSLRSQKLMSLSSNRDVLNAVSNIATYNLPLNYYSLQQQKLSAVTLKQVNNALRQVINPSSWAVVTVGGGTPGIVNKNK